ncbi:MAG: glycosyltransferase family 1 protein [Ruthenibacterium sp.]
MNQPLRVAQMIGKMNTGGVRTIVLDYYRRMDKAAVQFDFFVDADSHDVPYAEIEAAGGRVFVVPPYQRLPQYLRALIRLFKENHYTVVHAHINTLCVFPLFAAWLAGVPVRICHSHSTAHKSEGKRALLKYLLRPFARVFATDAFACGEKAGRWLYGDHCFDSGRVFVLPNAVDTPRFVYDAAARDSLRKELGIAQDAFVVGHVGRFMHQKNHKGLLDIFAAVLQKKQGARLLLVGEGELMDEVRAAVHARADFAPDSVIFTGARADVNRLYSAMDVFCLPSVYEGMPVVAAETQTSGLPCVSADTVSREAGMTALVHFVPLSAPPDVWAQAVIDAAAAYGARRSWNAEVAAAGFDLAQQGARLQNAYLSRAAGHSVHETYAP